MDQDTQRHARRPPANAAAPHERFVELLTAMRSPILASYTASLEALEGSILAKPHGRNQALIDASEILSDVAAYVCRAAGSRDDRYEARARIPRQRTAESPVNPADLLRATAGLFDITVRALARPVQDDPELMPCFVSAVAALNETISKQVREATLAYTGYLLERIDRAHIDERHRIARDVHDRLGEGISAALRQLELYEITKNKDSLAANPWPGMAKDALTEAMRRLRVVTSDLRQDPIRSLEVALVQYIDSAVSDADVRLRVSGDEKLAPSVVIEEAFLIVQEAIRNALQHAGSRQVLIGVAFAPHELHAWVEDDGCGFVPTRASAEAGLVTMRERADLVGGRLTIASVPGHGTEVDLVIQLTGHGDE